VPFVTCLGNKRGEGNEREVPWLFVRRIYEFLRNTIKVMKYLIRTTNNNGDLANVPT
jgi:hypothetical protein